MPDLGKLKQAIEMLQSCVSEYDTPAGESAGDGGQDPVTDLAPLDSEPNDKKKAKIASYGAMLKKKMGY